MWHVISPAGSGQSLSKQSDACTSMLSTASDSSFLKESSSISLSSLGVFLLIVATLTLLEVIRSTMTSAPIKYHSEVASSILFSRMRHSQIAWSCTLCVLFSSAVKSVRNLSNARHSILSHKVSISSRSSFTLAITSDDTPGSEST